MRVGKKPSAVEVKKSATRSCVVRLEKVRSQSVKLNHNKAVAIPIKSSAKMSLPKQENIVKGPLKKRPIADSTPPARMKPKFTEKAAKETPERFVPTPTIAAGRSRRAIKPNPKYASEDIVTPKALKNASSVGVSGNKKSLDDKQRKHSTSSSDDFFNKDSSDELGADELDDLDDKAFNVTIKDTDSDFSDIDLEPPPLRMPPRRRGRPSKQEKALWDGLRAKMGTPAASTQKSGKTTTPLQQIRKSLASSAAKRAMEVASATRKRKLDSAAADRDNVITRKRFVLTPLTTHYKTPGKDMGKSMQMNHRNLMLQKSMLTPTVNGNNKSAHSQISGEDESEVSREPRRTMMEKSVAKLIAKPTSNLTMLNKSLSAKLISSGKRRSASPKVVKEIEIKEDKKVESTAPLPADDFESMPTFTIVNINDIINKKGDVLISKTVPKAPVVKTQDTQEAKSTTPPPPEAKFNRRKAGHTTILSEKIDSERLKHPLPRTPFPPKKPIQTILNHTLLNKLSANNESSFRSGRGSPKESPVAPPSKPAPRILNSMVAKKTQPVKPMITNLDDSADESYALSLDDEDDMDDDEDTTFVMKGRLPATSPNASISPKQGESPAKDNSSSNRFQSAPLQHKLSPEKVIISRQGDKIIKKITCFETWYVINVGADPPAKIDRNLLELPLIDLANMAKSITLPSESWSTKVTLFELSPTTLAKSTMLTYLGDLKEHKIAEEDRTKYQPSCVMFRRAVNDRLKSRLPYDRAVIFKNKTFFTNIEGKNVRLLGAPKKLSNQEDVEAILEVVDSLTLQSQFVEPTSTVQ